MAYGKTDPGLVRATNQDALGCYPEAGLYVVADGVGGQPAGEIASRLAVEAVRVTIVSAPPPSAAATALGLLGAAVRRANERVLAEAERDPTCHGMATTLSALFLWGGVAHVAHVGDCRIYRWCPGGPLRRLTRDHNRAQSLVDQDVITEEQAANHPWSHQLERALGVQLSVDADLTSEECRPDDRFLLCSDGLIRVVREEEIASVLGAPSTPRGQVEHLVSLARARGAPDNVTVIALHCRAFAMGEASHADETVDPG